MISSDRISQLNFGSYNDYKSGQSINQNRSASNSTDKENSQLSELRAVADQFEAIFLENLLRQARKSKLSNELFDSKADDNFQQMFDEELAKSSSKLVDIGIADAIVRQMAKTRAENERPIRELQNLGSRLTKRDWLQLAKILLMLKRTIHYGS